MSRQASARNAIDCNSNGVTVSDERYRYSLVSVTEKTFIPNTRPAATVVKKTDVQKSSMGWRRPETRQRQKPARPRRQPPGPRAVYVSAPFRRQEGPQAWDTWSFQSYQSAMACRGSLQRTRTFTARCAHKIRESNSIHIADTRKRASISPTARATEARSDSITRNTLRLQHQRQ